MRTLAYFAGAFSLGIFLAQYLLPEGWLLWIAVLFLGLGCACLFLPEKWMRRGVAVFAALALALGYHRLYCRQVQKPMEMMAGTEQTVTMTLCGYAEPTERGAKATVKVNGLPAKIVYYGNEILLELQPGQTVADTVSFRSAARIRDDDVTTFTSKGIFLLAYGQEEDVKVGSGSMDSLHWLPARTARAMQARIYTLFSGDAAGFLAAILTGDRSGLSVRVSNELSEIGIYHLLAVSGMHCGFLLSMVQLLLGRHRRRLVAACTVPLLIFYAFLTGGSPSVVRACVMLSLLLAAPLFHRENDGPTTLLTALFLILLQNPFAAPSASLQLSFAAIAGVLWLTPKLYELLGKGRGRIGASLAASFSATMGALVFSTPISAFCFGTLPLISPVSNLLCLWAAGLMFMTGMAAVALSFLWLPLGNIVSFLPQLLAEYILQAARLLAKVPYHAVYFVNPYLKYWLIFVYILFAAAWLTRGRRKYAAAAGCAVLTLIAAVRLGTARYDGALETIVLDAGQGQCVVLASGDAFALVDCGSANSWYDPGGDAADQLLTMGCGKLDYLILTHYDSDHINGLADLLSRLEVETLLLPAPLDEDGLQETVLVEAERSEVTVTYVETVIGLPLGSAGLTVFPPVSERAGDNERGLSLLAALDGQELLITGDMDAETERQLMTAYALPDIEALVAGHHGAKNSTSEDFLKALKPETVCISVGSNRYGHPAEETLVRLAENGCTVYRTDLHGDIRLSWN